MLAAPTGAAAPGAGAGAGAGSTAERAVRAESGDATLSQVLEVALSRIDTVIQLRVAATNATAAGAGPGEAAGVVAGSEGGGTGGGGAEGGGGEETEEGAAGSTAQAVVEGSPGDEDVIMADVEIMERMDALLSLGMDTVSSPSSSVGGAQSPEIASSRAGSGATAENGGAEGAPSEASAAAAAATAAAAGGERGSRHGAAATEGRTNSMRAMVAQHRLAADRLRRTIELRMRRENSAGTASSSPTSAQEQARAKAEAERR